MDSATTARATTGMRREAEAMRHAGMKTTPQANDDSSGAGASEPGWKTTVDGVGRCDPRRS
jgi:hypothetical protein